MRVKICGVRTAEALEAAAGADWVGFVFFARSPRCVTGEEAAALLEGRPAPRRVGLFVEPGDEEVRAVLAGVRLDVLQVYASEARVAALRALSGLEVWRAVGVAGVGDLPAESGADGLVVESRAPAGAGRPGGNGVAVDWGLLRGWAAPVPWMLAGGLDAGNVAEAVAQSGAVAVDVSSGVERAPGVKDAGMIRAFIEAARGAEAGR
ncbi:MAG: phosphoribosylanthranilate isomerase [Janthinobacterium lividum]